MLTLAVHYLVVAMVINSIFYRSIIRWYTQSSDVNLRDLPIIDLRLNHLCLKQGCINHLRMAILHLPQLFALHTHFDLVDYIALALPFYL